MNTAAELTVPQTILQQLGGNKFLAMTGAKNLLGDVDSLTFKLPARITKDGITHVRIRLMSTDLYGIEWLKIRGTRAPVQVAEDDGIHAEQLRSLFTARTGLDVAL
jgi:hypothetical protein